LPGLRARDGARELVHAFKYQRRIHLHRELGALAAEALDDPRIAARKDWILVPVPLHWRRQQWRWFNQAHEIARNIARLRGLPLTRALHRSRATPQQILLTRDQRLKNLRNAFRLSRHERKHRRLQGKPVLLVDDVFTTGSTAHECASVLKDQAGAEIVVVLTALRG
jgi:ComF family protein